MGSRIAAILTQEDNRLTVHVTSMIDSLRHAGKIAESGHFTVRSVSYPDITAEEEVKLFLPGQDRSRDSREPCYPFGLKRTATTSRIVFTTLLNKINSTRRSGTKERITVVGTTDNPNDIVIRFKQKGPDVAIYVLQMPERVKKIFHERPTPKTGEIIAISSIQIRGVIYNLLIGDKPCNFINDNMMMLNVDQDISCEFNHKYKNSQEATRAIIYFIEAIAKFNTNNAINNKIVVSVE